MATEHTPADPGPIAFAGLRVTPLHADFVGRVSGIDLGRSVSDVHVDAIHAAMDRFGVLVFPDQALDDEQLFALGCRFGPVEDAATGTYRDRQRLENPQINDISNLRPNGSLLAADDRHRMTNLGNQLWHSDSSFKTRPAQYSLLHARVIPPEGGETEFADMRAAWDALPQQRKQAARALVCEHSMIHSRSRIGVHDFSQDELARCTPVPQRLVRRHPRTERLSLFLSSHIGGIQGWPTPEALLFIQDLIEFATQREFVHRHAWQVHDLVIWDNQSTMHRGRPYDSHRYPRDLRRVTLQGTASTLEDIV